MKKLLLSYPLSWCVFFVIIFQVKTFAQSSVPASNKDNSTTIEKRRYAATKIIKTPKIDGEPNDDVWKTIPKTGDFTQFDPKPFEKSSQPTEVQIAYDNDAIYVLAYLHDDPNLIRKDLSQRDNIGGNTDYFTISFDPFDDDQNGIRFIVTAAGTQGDCKVGRFELGNGNGWTNADFSWDAVWQSAVSMQKDGWVAEMKIPYMALRFPRNKVQNWGFQCARQIKRFGETDTWQVLDPKVDGQVIQWGYLTDLKDIEPPLRLSLSPYVAGIFQRLPYDNNGKTSFVNRQTLSGGMDLKYGINESFTLDATLIPNFGQVQSDNLVLNLSPFEVKYEERRPFFTEGTELFNKGDIFYSRRVGGTPTGFWSVSDNLKKHEIIESNPTETQLYNATKLSGRTNGKLGVGFFNAVAAPMYATVKDTLTGIERSIQTSELTNYNITVLSQALKNNSEISFTNANTWRNGTAPDANVSALKTRFRDKKNEYELAIGGRMSHIFDPSVKDVESGYTADWSVQKVSGNWTWSVDQTMQTNTWNPNDLGIFTGNNFLNSHVGIFYNQYKPGKTFLQWQTWFNINQNQRYKPFSYQDYGINGGFWGKFKNQGWANYWFYTQPAWSYDFFEPRYSGKQFRRAPMYNNGLNIGTDERKRLQWYFYVGSNWHFWGDNLKKTNNYRFIVNPFYRVSKSLRVGAQVDYSLSNNGYGYATDNGEEDITFGRRNRRNWENSININYNFSTKMDISLRARHYWSKVTYLEFFKLNDDGNLVHRDWNANQNQNVNFFNVDMVYTWQFAPGSFLNLIWKTSVSDFESGDNVAIRSGYFNNFNTTMRAAKSNNLTLKVIYFLDYQTAKKWVSK